MKNIVIIVIAIIVIAGGAFYFAKLHSSPQQDTSMTPSSNEQIAQKQSNPTGKNVVKYTEDGFSPKTLTIKQGETVTWINEDSDPMWIASNPHPVHTDYPESGGCSGSKFDACKPIEKGGSYSFTFDKTGNWGYHNHLTPSNMGTIIVQ